MYRVNKKGLIEKVSVDQLLKTEMIEVYTIDVDEEKIEELMNYLNSEDFRWQAVYEGEE